MKRLLFMMLLLPGAMACNLLQVKVTPDPFYSAVLQQNPDSQAALYSQGRRFLRQGRYAEAQPYFERLTRQAPQNADAWFNLGRCDYELRQFAKAREAFQQAEKLHPSEASILGLATACLMDGKLEQARRLVVESEQKYGVSAALLQIRGDLAYLTGDAAGALALYRQSLKQNPAQPELQGRIKDLEDYLTSAG